jgi:hypothetical protein
VVGPRGVPLVLRISPHPLAGRRFTVSLHADGAAVPALIDYALEVRVPVQNR